MKMTIKAALTTFVLITPATAFAQNSPTNSPASPSNAIVAPYIAPPLPGTLEPERSIPAPPLIGPSLMTTDQPAQTQKTNPDQSKTQK